MHFYKLYKCIKFDYNRPFFGSYAREIPWTPAQILMWSGDTGFGGSRRDRAYQRPPRHILIVEGTATIPIALFAIGAAPSEMTSRTAA